VREEKETETFKKIEEGEVRNGERLGEGQILREGKSRKRETRKH
jgi:hypothetical protein